MENTPTIWVLADDRPGNVNQALGVAEATGLPFMVKTIRYTSLARLPNFIRCKSLLGITPSTKQEITAPWPNIVISAGRKTAPIALYIKKKSPATKIVQIMRPGFSTRYFNLVVLPEHDKKTGEPKVITTQGAPNRISTILLATEKTKWENKFSSLPEPRIALLVGGNTKKGDFTQDHANELCAKATRLVQESGGSLLVTTSRRTPEHVIDFLKEKLPSPKYFYDFRDGGENPYTGFLACADVIIPSGDSISMCSESCTTGKPVYIFSPASLVAPKHQRFQENLVARNYARRLGDAWGKWSYTPLNDAQIVANFIKENYC